MQEKPPPRGSPERAATSEPDAGGASSQAINSEFGYQLEPSVGDRATSQASCSECGNQHEPGTGKGATSQAINSKCGKQHEPSAGEGATSQVINSCCGNQPEPCAAEGGTTQGVSSKGAEPGAASCVNIAQPLNHPGYAGHVWQIA